ncbi:hypothetical protein [Vitiosangium sp. GDMCC 1.1324]|uniref:hypothetical protein n=1 Tax=Vitiosangium sp. (strain GDMCC 1.1324) TaxID=2138576 RepID=UPI000D3A82D1|nr:hypothetical protein [Vitiosangium sp. GDMCC 1.1324]PTL83250.1 hypothetical protein DAT35_14765 [Vitiosangium sp. GDMCC 1.1324]
MMPSTSKRPSAPSLTTVRRATPLTAALGLLLACGGLGTWGPAPEESGQNHLDLHALPEHCEVDKTCGNLVGVNCRSEVDGPYYYVEQGTNRIVETCGGACMGGPRPEEGLCVECPPKAWSCD